MSSNYENQSNPISADLQSLSHNNVVQPSILPINYPIIYNLPNSQTVPNQTATILQTVPVIQSQNIITPPSSQRVLQISVASQSAQNLPQSTHNLPQPPESQPFPNEKDTEIGIDTDSDDGYCDYCDLSKVSYI